MKKAVVITIDQAKTLRYLRTNGAVTATDSDRSVLDSLAERGYATKHHNGSFVSFSISPAGKFILDRL